MKKVIIISLLMVLVSASGFATPKPLLLLKGAPSASGWPTDRFDCEVMRVLETLGVPFLQADPALLDDEGNPIDETIYAGALFLYANSSTATHQSWLSGARGIPVLAVGYYREGLNTQPGCETGMVVNAGTALSAYHTIADPADPTSRFAMRGGTVVEDLNAAGEAVWRSSVDNKVFSWKLANRGSLPAVQYVANMGITQRGGIWLALTALRLFDMDPPVHPRAIRIDMDDVWGMGEQGISGFEALIAYARSKGIILICGVDGGNLDWTAVDLPDGEVEMIQGDRSAWTRATRHADNYIEAAEVRALIQANADVCKVIDHTHSVPYPASDDAPYDTVNNKIAIRTAILANLRSQGYDVSEGGYLGHYYFPFGVGSIKSWKALSQMGVKCIRNGEATSVYIDGSVRYSPFVGQNPVLRDNDGGLVRGRACACPGLGANTKCKAEFGTSTDVLWNMHGGATMRMLLTGYSSGMWGSPSRADVTMWHLRPFADTTALPFWEAGTEYAEGDVVCPTNAFAADSNGFYYRCSTAGVSGECEPTWPTQHKSSTPAKYQVTDGTAVWTLDPWAQGGDQAGLYVMAELDLFIQYSNGWLKYADDEDLRLMATLDTAPPTGSILINDGDQYAGSSPVTLTLSSTDSAQMRFNNENGAWSDWEAYGKSKSWPLSDGDGAKTVYAEYKDAAGNVSTETISDGITLDTTGPSAVTVTDEGVYTPSMGELIADWSASSDPESGVSQYQYAIGTASGGNDVVDWTPVAGTTVTATGLTLTSAHTYYFSVQAKNGAGTWSGSGLSDGIRPVDDTGTIADAKSVEDGPTTGVVALLDKVVTADFGTCFYIEEGDTFSAIRVDADGPAQGTTVSVAGVISTANCERSITTATVKEGVAGTIPPSRYLRNAWVGGDALNAYTPGLPGKKGVNNIGLLVDIIGSIEHVDTGFMYVDDGSALEDGSGYIGLRVDTALLSPSKAAELVPTYHAVLKGIIMTEPSLSAPLLKLRDDADVVSLYAIP